MIQDRFLTRLLLAVFVVALGMAWVAIGQRDEALKRPRIEATNSTVVFICRREGENGEGD